MRQRKIILFVFPFARNIVSTSNQRNSVSFNACKEKHARLLPTFEACKKKNEHDKERDESEKMINSIVFGLIEEAFSKSSIIIKKKIMQIHEHDDSFQCALRVNIQ